MHNFRDDVRKLELFCQELSKGPFLVRYGVATVLVLIALAARMLLNPLVHNRFPLTFFLTSGIVAALVGGFGPGLYALLFGFLLGDYFFLPPVGSIFVYGKAELISLISTLVPGLIAISIVSLLHHARDELQASSRKLNIINEHLEQSVRDRTAELEAFCYSVSHDLRAPVRKIASFTELLYDEYGRTFTEEGREMFRTVIASAYRMDQLIHDLLRLSRLSRCEVQYRLVDLSALVEKVADAVGKNDPNRRVDFVIAPNLIALGDENMLQIAFENLIGNAWKFTQSCPRGRIEFGSENIDGQTAYYLRDNGIGFNMADTGKLFGVFERLHSDAEIPGTGIGLAIVQRIINRLGGKIWAKGIVNEGATFYFTLPRQAESAGQTANSQPAQLPCSE
jgi:K+-sensing histidine kinase KdpD